MDNDYSKSYWLFCVVVIILILNQSKCEDCELGKYGTGIVECSIDCPKHCNGGICDKLTGLCSSGCNDGYYGGRCNRQIKCNNVSGDPRGQPDDMNTSPGAWLNIFLNLTIPTSGKLSTLQYYSERNVSTYVGFWRHISHTGNTFTMELAGKLLVDVKSGYHEVDVRDSGIYVNAGDAIGTHYDSGLSSGSIEYHRADREEIDGLYAPKSHVFINEEYYNDDLYIDRRITHKVHRGRIVALRVFTECNEECETGKYGRHPASCTTCSENCRDGLTCDARTGTCPAGCNAGWKSGSCQTRCEAGTYGENCLNTCVNCLNRTCDPETGHCKTGCRSGFLGLQCEHACEAGTYGKNCLKRCMTCRNGECDNENGYCYTGCKSGYYGSRCQKECLVGSYGRSCNATCSAFCVDDCHHIDGNCTCSNGGSGPKCKIITSKDPSQHSHHVHITVGFLCGFVLASIILGIVIVIVIRRKYGRCAAGASHANDDIDTKGLVASYIRGSENA